MGYRVGGCRAEKGQRKSGALRALPKGKMEIPKPAGKSAQSHRGTKVRRGQAPPPEPKGAGTGQPGMSHQGWAKNPQEWGRQEPPKRRKRPPQAAPKGEGGEAKSQHRVAIKTAMGGRGGGDPRSVSPEDRGPPPAKTTTNEEQNKKNKEDNAQQDAN